MLKTCPKCRHENHDATGADDESCPSCGVIYKKALEAIRAKRAEQQKAINKIKRRQDAVAPPREKFITPSLAKAAYVILMVLAGFGIYEGFALSTKAGLVAIGAFVAVGIVGAIILEAAIVLFVIADAVQDTRDHLAVLRAQAEVEADA